MYEGNSSARYQTCMLPFPHFTCMKQEFLHTVNGVPLVTCWHSESFAVVQEGGAQLGLTVTTLAVSAFKWPPHLTNVTPPSLIISADL